MPRSESESQFDNFLAQNQQNFLASRGATSPYRVTELPFGSYMCKIIKATRSTQQSTVYIDNKPTDQKQTVGVVQLHCVVIADADPKTQFAHREAFSGVQVFVTYKIKPGDQDSWNRCVADLDHIGVPTRKFVPSLQHVQDPNNQLTFEQGLDMITRSKPCCIVNVSENKASGAGGKYVNYRDNIKQEEVEKWIGHPINQQILVAAENTPEPQNLENMMVPGQTMGQPSMMGQPQTQYPMGMGMTQPGMVQPGQLPGTNPMQQPYTAPPTMNYPGAAPLPSPQMANPPQQPGVFQSNVQPHKFAGDPSQLQLQPDGTYFYPANQLFYDAQGNYVPTVPKLPEPPAPVVAPMAPPQQPGYPAMQPPQMPGQPMQPGYTMQYPGMPGGVPQPPQMPGMQTPF